jgi:hypothetical protein
MSRSQKYISILLERLPKWELRSYDHQTSLDQLRNRISSADDIQSELRSLYKVNGFSDFALSLMWIADKVARDSSLEESTLDEETLVFTKFRQAVGDMPTPVQGQPQASPTFDLSTAAPGFESTPSPQPAPMFDSMWGGHEVAQQATEPSGMNGGGNSQGNDQERNFASLLEKFLESVQSGTDDRSALLTDVVNECNGVLSSGSAPSDYRNFCQLLIEFLKYISDNQFLDDVRVMNIVSNIQDPFAQWARSEPDGRGGILDQAVDILRDFKTMFE